MKNPASRSRARQGRQVRPPTAGQRQATGRGAGTEGKRRHHAVVHRWSWFPIWWGLVRAALA